MAVTRGGSLNSFSRSVTGTAADISHEVDVNTTLLVVSIMYEAGETVTTAPQWSRAGGQNLTLVDETTRSGSNNDMCVSTYALVSPDIGVGTVTIGVSSNDNIISTATNYVDTITSSVANAIALIEEDVNDAATA